MKMKKTAKPISEEEIKCPNSISEEEIKQSSNLISKE